MPVVTTLPVVTATVNASPTAPSDTAMPPSKLANESTVNVLLIFVTPSTSKVPPSCAFAATSRSPPTNAFSLMPTPPVTISEPVDVLVLPVPVVIDTGPTTSKVFAIVVAPVEPTISNTFTGVPAAFQISKLAAALRRVLPSTSTTKSSLTLKPPSNSASADAANVATLVAPSTVNVLPEPTVISYPSSVLPAPPVIFAESIVPPDTLSPDIESLSYVTVAPVKSSAPVTVISYPLIVLPVPLPNRSALPMTPPSILSPLSWLSASTTDALDKFTVPVNVLVPALVTLPSNGPVNL